MAAVNTVAGPPPNVAPPGLKGLIVADTAVGTVRGEEGWYHYRGHDATVLARQHSFDAVAHLLLEGSLPDPATEAAFRAELGEARSLTSDAAELVATLAATELPQCRSCAACWASSSMRGPPWI